MDALEGYQWVTHIFTKNIALLHKYCHTLVTLETVTLYQNFFVIGKEREILNDHQIQI